MTFSPMVLAYLGPETMLPMTSVVAGAVGVVMMFGRSSVRWVVGVYRRFAPASKPATPVRRIGSGPLGASRVKTRTKARVES